VKFEVDEHGRTQSVPTRGNANQVQPPGLKPGRAPLPPSKLWKPDRKIPPWAWLLAFFCVALFVATALFRMGQNVKDRDAHKIAEVLARETERNEAAERLVMLRQQKRNRLFARCREDGNYPLLFIDKIVCVKPESIAWVKYDDNPEQDTAGDEPKP